MWAAACDSAGGGSSADGDRFDPDPPADLDPDIAGDRDDTTDGTDAPVEEREGFDIIIPGDDDAEPEIEEEAPPPRDCRSQPTLCRSGEYCDPQGTCRRRLSLCEPCTAQSKCGFSDRDGCINYGYTEGPNRCSLECQDNADCSQRPFGPGWSCDLAAGQCRFARPAAGSPKGELGAGCCASEDCKDGLACSPTTLRCIEGCRTDLDCNPNFVCVSGTCRPGCARTADCPTGAVCNPTTKQCQQGQCFVTGECPPENACIGASPAGPGTCRPGCEADTDCLEGKECRVPPGGSEKQCVIRTGCESTGDCGIGFWCDFNRPDAANPQRGTCVVLPVPSSTCCGCSQDSDCGQGGRCLEIRFTCENKEDCGDANDPNIACTNQRCVRNGRVDDRKGYKICIVPYDCKRRNDQGQTVGTLDCPRGFTCSALQEQQQGGATRESSFCFLDCNNYCKRPSRYQASTCTAQTPLVCCAEGENPDVCNAL